MATYKAEFLSHYYSGRMRPMAAYSMGLVFLWARLAAHAPGLANFVLQSRGVGAALRRFAGFAPEREPPQFAPETFQHWFFHRGRAAAGHASGRTVILWPDTFNNYFLPSTAKAAVSVLEDAGYEVAVPRQRLCCGRPLYDYGMLDLAKRKLRQTIDALRPAIRAGVPVVGLEPSCVSVFRDELRNLMPGDEDAQRLASQTMLLSEFLMRDPGWKPPQLERKALVHMHCHHRSVLDDKAQEKMLAAMGLDVSTPKVGCCGQAGSFGYERDHYDVAMAVGEQDFLPAVRDAAPSTLIIADGFSCREQIAHGTDRWALHPAEVLALAARSSQALPVHLPAKLYREQPAQLDRQAVAKAGAMVGVAAAIGCLLYVGLKSFAARR
jgi:Fe-S oxidoreductase